MEEKEVGRGLGATESDGGVGGGRIDLEEGSDKSDENVSGGGVEGGKGGGGGGGGDKEEMRVVPASSDVTLRGGVSCRCSLGTIICAVPEGRKLRQNKIKVRRGADLRFCVRARACECGCV